MQSQHPDIHITKPPRFQGQPEAAATSPPSWEKPRQGARAPVPGAAEPAACPAHTRRYEPSHPRTMTALCLPVCCLFQSPFTEFPTRSEPRENQRQAETPSLRQEVSSLKFRHVTEERGSLGRKTGIVAEASRCSALWEQTSPSLSALV